MFRVKDTEDVQGFSFAERLMLVMLLLARIVFQSRSWHAYSTPR
jgi:hypothetical protein